MSVYKDGKTWRVQFRYKDAFGKLRQTTKRGFETKKEALHWERSFLLKANYSERMFFQDLYELYIKDQEYRLKQNTMITKQNIFEQKILPYFKNKRIDEITPVKIRDWQNIMLDTTDSKGKKLSATYLKTINNQLSAIFNYAVNYHNLSYNPCKRAGSIGTKKAKEMKIWTVDEFNLFSNTLKKDKDKFINYVGFNVLFWTGIRIGELLALTLEDIDFDKKILRINKSYQRINGQDVVTSPKTSNSVRTLHIGDNLIEIFKEYLSYLYKPIPEMRLFDCTKSKFEKDIKYYANVCGLKMIRLHDLRHSHASYLFNQGIDIITISKRLGHEDIKTTLNVYAHTYNVATEKLIKTLNNDVE